MKRNLCLRASSGRMRFSWSNSSILKMRSSNKRYERSCSMLRGGCEGRRRMLRRDFEATLNVDEFTERQYLPSSSLKRALTFDFEPALRSVVSHHHTRFVFRICVCMLTFDFEPALRIMLAGGSPSRSQIRQICSPSLRPLKSGCPVCISTRIHPKLHISIGNEYAPHRSTSGDLV